MKEVQHLPEQENKKPKQNTGSVVVKIAIMAAISLVISWNTLVDIDEKNTYTQWQVDEPKNDNAMDESLDIISEQMFKAAVAQALAPINDLQDIPAWGIPLKYPPSAAENLPTTINFYPKKMIAKTLPFTIIMIGKTMYVATPEYGFAVDKMYVDEKSFNVAVSRETMLGEIRKEVSKSKNKEMPDYLARLLKEGAGGKYIWSSITVVTSKEGQTEYFRKLNEANK